MSPSLLIAPADIILYENLGWFITCSLFIVVLIALLFIRGMMRSDKKLKTRDGDFVLSDIYDESYLFKVLWKFGYKDNMRDEKALSFSRDLNGIAEVLAGYRKGEILDLEAIGSEISKVKRSLFECMEQRFTLPDFEEEDMGEGQSGEEGSEEVQVEEQEAPEQIFATADRGEV